jgi:gamma-glutamyltranspeptidase/glutathione hydrolase
MVGSQDSSANQEITQLESKATHVMTGLVRTTMLVLLLADLSSPADAETTWAGGVVAADHPLASQAGLEILELGGNAVDAAVATSFALSVVRPYSCGIGGGGFMLIHEGDIPRGTLLDAANAPEPSGCGPPGFFIDYRERAPAAVTPDYYERLDDPQASLFTGHAVGVPGTVAGLLLALERFGKLDRATVMAPAIRLAEEGYEVDRHYLLEAAEAGEWIEEDPEVRPARHRFLWDRFLKRGEIAPGDRIRLPEQAAALRLIAEEGADAFYRGPIGEAIVEAVAAAGGPMTSEDLGAYEPGRGVALIGEFRGRMLLTMPPPSSGGVAMIQALEMLERYEATRGVRLEQLGHNRPGYVHLVAEAMKHVFADRAEWFGDPLFVKVPVARLTDEDYIAERAALIDPYRTQPMESYGSHPPPPDDHGTSHICVIDQWGGAVSCSETINLPFGSGIAVDRFGFLLNNELDDFTTMRGQANAFGLRQSDRNRPAPGKRPLSSMSPTIVLGWRGRVDLIAGGSGGPRIITGTLQVILNALVFGMSAAEAVASPRFHHQWSPDLLALEPAKGSDGLPLTTIGDELRAKGHEVVEARSVGVVQLIVRAGGGFGAASDPRKGGAPAGRFLGAPAVPSR